MGFFFPAKFFGVEHSELAFLGLSEQVFFRCLHWRKTDPNKLREYIAKFVESNTMSKFLNTLQEPQAADFEYIKRQLVWKQKSTGASDSIFELGKSVGQWISTFKNRPEGESETLASWQDFASKVSKSYKIACERVNLTLTVHQWQLKALQNFLQQGYIHGHFSDYIHEYIHKAKQAQANVAPAIEAGGAGAGGAGAGGIAPGPGPGIGAAVGGVGAGNGAAAGGLGAGNGAAAGGVGPGP